jgi:uncharacterized protein DUF1579
MDMPRPGAAHEKLKAFVGQWSGEETIAPSPMDPTGGTAYAKIDNRLALGGFVVIQDYAQERGGTVNFEGHMVMSYDAAKNEYVMDWWDSFGLGRTEYRGTFEGRSLTLVATTPMGRARATYDHSQDGFYGFKMEISVDGATWIPFMTGEYKRLGG